MLIRVDLPAPFSPRRQSTSPGIARRLMWSFATTPGNVLVISTSSTAGVSTPAVDVTGTIGPGSITADTMAVDPRVSRMTRLVYLGSNAVMSACE